MTRSIRHASNTAALLAAASVLLVVASPALGSAAPAPATVPAAVAAKTPPTMAHAESPEEAAVRKLHDDFAAAWATNDAKAVAAFWAPDGDLIAPTGSAWKGRGQVETFFTEAYATFFKGTRMAVTLRSIRFLTPDIAIADYAYEVLGEKTPSGVSQTDNGLYTAINVKMDGKWWIVAARPMIPWGPPAPPLK